MKRFTILPILMLTLWSGCSKSGGGVKLHTDTDSVAYVIGLNVGANLLKMDSTLNAAAVCKGIADYFAGRQSMTMEEAQTFYLRYVNYAVPEKIREQERRFLDDVTSGQGFKSSESGLRYDVTRDGDLKRTIASDTARIAVRIKALRRDGGEIYSSYERGDTLRTRLDSLPAGLREGLKLLGSGGAVKLWVPAGLRCRGRPDVGSGGQRDALLRSRTARRAGRCARRRKVRRPLGGFCGKNCDLPPTDARISINLYIFVCLCTMKLYKNFDTQMKKLLSVAALAGAVLLCSCGGNKTLKMGSLSKFDSLSYALGANIGYGMQYEMSDIPFNFEEVNKGIKEGALDKSKQKHEDAIDILRDYFMNKRGARAFAIQQKKAMQAAVAADSTGMLKDTLPAAEPMFLTPGECDSVSYAFGNDIGNNIKSSDIPVQIVWITEAMANVRDSVAKMDEMIVQGYLQNYFMVVRPRENAEASAKWLEGIAKKSGVEKTESGLLYKIERPGDADTIAVDDRDVVVVNYEGKNRKGKVFDSSYERNEPAEFPLNRVIKGWTEGMKLVGKGGKITLWIPAELAYGERGAGRDIGANEALEFSVEVVDVKPYVEPAPADSTKVAEPAKK